MTTTPPPDRPSVALITLGVIVCALFVAWAALPLVAEFVGAYRRRAP